MSFVTQDLGSNIPVVPHKAVAKVSKIGNVSERLVVVNHGWQSVGVVVFFGVAAMVAAVTSPQLLDVVWCSAVAFVFCICSVVEL